MPKPTPAAGAGADNDTANCSDVVPDWPSTTTASATEIVGVPAVDGVTAFEAGDHGPAPYSLRPRTRKRYFVPLARPVTSRASASVPAAASMPPAGIDSAS